MTTKEKVKAILIEAAGCADTATALSGEKLAAECGVSRAAIWKAVNALRQEGLQIEGTPNGGYALCDADVFTPELFKRDLAKSFPEFSDCHTEVFKEIDSTNTYAKRLLAECGALRTFGGELTEAGKRYHKAVIVAESQTAGRGRLGRTFLSPAKSGIYLSVIYAPEGGIQNPARLTAATAVAICRAIRKLYGIETQIKWINDIFYKGKKISGILAEGVTNFESGMIESAIVGMGINIKDNPEVFSGDLAKVAGSICGREESSSAPGNNVQGGNVQGNSVQGKCTQGESPKENITRTALAAQIAGEVLNIYEEDLTNHQQIIEEYRSLSFLIGKSLTVHPLIGDDKSAYTATAQSIDDDARLVVKLPDGSIRTLNSGEVSLHSSEI